MRIALLAAALWLSACGSVAGGCPSSLPSDKAAGVTGCLRYGIAPDSRQYSAGAAKIVFQVSATNVSSRSCAGSQELLCGGPSLKVSDAAGKVVWNRKRPALPCPLLVRLLQPGEKMTGQVEWDSPGIGPGTYSVTGADEDFGRAFFGVC